MKNDRWKLFRNNHSEKTPYYSTEWKQIHIFMKMQNIKVKIKTTREIKDYTQMPVRLMAKLSAAKNEQQHKRINLLNTKEKINVNLEFYHQ